MTLSLHTQLAEMISLVLQRIFPTIHSVIKLSMILIFTNCDHCHSFQILVAMGHIVKPPAINSLIVASKSEYKTRHLIDGRIVQCDQRISLVSGYMADEVYNLSPFTFMHRDDVRWVMVALRQSKSIELQSIAK